MGRKSIIPIFLELLGEADLIPLKRDGLKIVFGRRVRTADSVFGSLDLSELNRAWIDKTLTEGQVREAMLGAIETAFDARYWLGVKCAD